MSEQTQIDRFLSALRRRLNRFRLLDSLVWTLAGSAALLLIVSLTYILRGHAVPSIWYLILVPVIAVVTLLSWWIVRRDIEATARFADRFFGLKDAISSYCHFRKERRDGAVYELQGRTTATRVEAISPDSVQYVWPRRLLATTAGLAVICTMLAFKDASPEVVEKLRVQEETAVKTEEINRFLDEMVEELEKSEDDKALAEIDPAQVREWIAELKETGDRNEALRQYAELERKMQEAAKRLDQRRNENLLAKAGEELQKAEEQEPRALGKKLEEKKFREASDDLAKMAPEEVDPEKLDERTRELAKLKSAAQRMASAAAASARSSSAGSGKEASSSSDGQAKGSASKSSGENAGTDGQSGAGTGSEESLEGLLTRLDESVGKFENSLNRASLEKKQTGQCSSKTLGECRSDREALLSDLQKLSDSLCKSASRSECQSRLLSMCRKLGQCQGYLGESKFSSLSQCMSQGQGKGIGAGSVDSRREGESLVENSGQMSQLQGIKGQGPSDSSIEAADDGDGVSTRRSATREREFQRQVESFVQRDDVPDDVKDGVKEYFQRIHQSEAR